MQLKRLFCLIIGLSICSVVPLSGCGGGGGGGNSPSVPPTPTVPTDPTVPIDHPNAHYTRTIAPGDEWHYAAIVTDKTTGTKTTGETHIACSPPPTPFLDLENVTKRSINWSTATGTFNSSSYIWPQASVRSIYVVGDGNGTPVGSVLIMPGLWLEGYQFSSSNQIGWLSFHVIGADIVTTPLGTFRAWKCSIDTTIYGPRLNGTFWFAPQTGSYVKASYEFALTNGHRAVFEEVLTSTTTPLG